MKGIITRTQLINLLKSLVNEQRTTTLYVRTNDNHLITFGVDRGEIVSMRCGAKRGERAIPMIRQMRAGTYRLDDEHTPLRNAGITLPPSQTLLLLLAEEDEIEASDCEWVQDVLCKVLADYMGPIAPLVCRETVEAVGGLDSPEQVERVIDRLAREIDNSAEAERFRLRVKSELSHLKR